MLNLQRPRRLRGSPNRNAHCTMAFTYFVATGCIGGFFHVLCCTDSSGM